MKKTHATLFLILSFFVSGITLGAYIAYSNASTNSSFLSVADTGRPDMSLFWKVWDELDDKYVATHGTSTDKVTDQERIYGAIKGMTRSLGDPYTDFFPPEEAKAFEEEISGNFQGVGMEMGLKDDVLTVIAPLKGTPAERAGIEAGDKILKIDDTVTLGLSTDAAIKLIRGEKGTKVKFIIQRGNKDPFEVTVVRDTINIPTLNTKRLDNGIFLIQLYSFTDESPRLFRNALREFMLSKNDKLILDLRGNPGGYLSAAVDMASWFLPQGKVVVREDFGKDKKEVVAKSKGYDIFNDNLKFVILIDGGSASASEILAGALSEYGKAKIVGEKSFGKGSVQELIQVSPDTSLKVTIARWLTPNGKSISDEGIKPDVEVPMTNEDVKNGKDPQLDKAIELLNQ